MSDGDKQPISENYTYHKLVRSGIRWGRMGHYMANSLISTRLSEYKQHLGSKRHYMSGYGKNRTNN